MRWPWPTAARRHLRDLAKATGEDISLAVPLGRRVTYVDRVVGSRPVTVDIRLGQTLHLHATSVGKLFAAHDPVLRVAAFETPFPAAALEDVYLPDADRVLEAVDRSMAY